MSDAHDVLSDINPVGEVASIDLATSLEGPGPLFH